MDGINQGFAGASAQLLAIVDAFEGLEQIGAFERQNNRPGGLCLTYRRNLLSDMTYEDATAALVAAETADQAESQTPASDEIALLQQQAANKPADASTTQGETATPAPTDASAPESFTSIDPSLLPPELSGTYKSMQADYQRKTQELASQRQQYEQLGPVDQIQAAQELYQAIQDPSNWQQLHQELTQAMQDQGLTPAQAAQAATQTLQDQAQTPTGAPDLAPFLADPELSPLALRLQQLESRLTDRDLVEQQQREDYLQEQQQMALIGEYQRQEMAIRQSNPQYTDSDIDAIYEISSFHEGNLLQAQQRYDAMFQDRMSRYIAAKQGASNTPGLSSPAGSGVSSTAGPILDPKLAHQAGLAALRQIEALDQ